MPNQDKETTVKLQYRCYVTRKLEKHFCIKSGLLKESTEMEHDILYYPDLAEFGFHKLIYGGHYKHVALDNLWIGKKFISGGLYDSIVTARSLVPASRAEDVILSISLKEGVIWFVYEADEAYEGLGGIFVQTEEGNFVVEPIDHYLKFHHPNSTNE